LDRIVALYLALAHRGQHVLAKSSLEWTEHAFRLQVAHHASRWNSNNVNASSRFNGSEGSRKTKTSEDRITFLAPLGLSVVDLFSAEEGSGPYAVRQYPPSKGNFIKAILCSEANHDPVSYSVVTAAESDNTGQFGLLARGRFL
jgi:hypothetical protein